MRINYGYRSLGLRLFLLTANLGGGCNTGFPPDPSHKLMPFRQRSMPDKRSQKKTHRTIHDAEISPSPSKLDAHWAGGKTCGNIRTESIQIRVFQRHATLLQKNDWPKMEKFAKQASIAFVLFCFVLFFIFCFLFFLCSSLLSLFLFFSMFFFLSCFDLRACVFQLQTGYP